MLAASLLLGVVVSSSTASAEQPLPPIPDERPDRGITIAASFPGDPADVVDDRDAAPLVAAPVPVTKPDLPYLTELSVLSLRDAGLYRRIFQLQREADWEAADRLIDQLDDPILIGHVLAERYLHPTGWHSSFEELSDWLERFADHPQAQRIYQLALARQPAGSDIPAEPRDGHLENFDTETSLELFHEPGDDTDWSHLESWERQRLRDLIAQIRDRLSDGRPDSAQTILFGAEFTELADPLTFDRARAKIAHSYFLDGNDAKAWELGQASLERSGADAPLAGWSAGMAAYRSGELDNARRAFEILAAGNPRTSKLVASGAYWAARLNLMTGRPDKVRLYLEIAAERPNDFYGILARATLGEPLAFDHSLPHLSDSELSGLTAMPEVQRAVALAQAGQQQIADLEFKQVSATQKPGLAVALLTVADTLSLPATQFRFGVDLKRHFATRYEAALYPEPPWAPEDGFEVDPALVFAIMRQESRYESTAESYVGARGLMQIMPTTADYISDGYDFAGADRHLLDDPVMSVTLAQDYIQHLMDLGSVDGNLFYMLVAYNAGPGNLERWQDRNGPVDDPLLFMETIPVRETRSFVEKVMANYWMYRLRLGGMTPSLAKVASGHWPVYDDGELIRVAGY